MKYEVGDKVVYVERDAGYGTTCEVIDSREQDGEVVYDVHAIILDIVSTTTVTWRNVPESSFIAG